MNKQFQQDIILAHRMNKNIDAKLATAEISIIWLDIKEVLSKTIWSRRWSLLEQLKEADFNIPNSKKYKELHEKQ